MPNLQEKFSEFKLQLMPLRVKYSFLLREDNDYLDAKT